MENGNTPDERTFSARQQDLNEEKFAAVLAKIEEDHPEFFFDLGKSIHETVLWDYAQNKFTFDSDLRPDIIEDCINALKNAGLFHD